MRRETAEWVNQAFLMRLVIDARSDNGNSEAHPKATCVRGGRMLSVSKWGVVAATAVSLAALAGSASASHDPYSLDRVMSRGHTEVIRLTSTSTGTTVVDNGTSGPGIGDQIIITANLFRNGAGYGTEGAVCTRVAAETTLCSGTFSLPRGQVSWQHLKTSPIGTPPSDFDIAITGGTGAYATVRGYARVARIAESGGALALYLLH